MALCTSPDTLNWTRPELTRIEGRGHGDHAGGPAHAACEKACTEGGAEDPQRAADA